MKNNTKTVTATAMLVALIIVANLIDKAYSQWLVAIGGASLAVCVLMATATLAFVFDKFYYAVIAGLAFGVVSFVFAFIFPSPLFQNPAVSIVPRLFIGIIGYGVQIGRAHV